MEDSKWPGWGNGILGDCGSPDPGSIPGPGPILLLEGLTCHSVKVAPQCGHLSSVSVTGLPQAGHSYTSSSDGVEGAATLGSFPLSSDIADASATSSANTSNSVPHAAHLRSLRATCSPQKGHSNCTPSNDAPQRGHLSSLPETVLPHATHAITNTGSESCAMILR
jgi:hypothetical protein